MPLIIYGDFNCPHSYLAGQRADLLSRSGAASVDWRTVEHDRGLAWFVRLSRRWQQRR